MTERGRVRVHRDSSDRDGCAGLRRQVDSRRLAVAPQRKRPESACFLRPPSRL